MGACMLSLWRCLVYDDACRGAHVGLGARVPASCRTSVGPFYLGAVHICPVPSPITFSAGEVETRGCYSGEVQAHGVSRSPVGSVLNQKGRMSGLLFEALNAANVTRTRVALFAQRDRRPVHFGRGLSRILPALAVVQATTGVPVAMRRWERVADAPCIYYRDLRRRFTLSLEVLHLPSNDLCKLGQQAAALTVMPTLPTLRLCARTSWVTALARKRAPSSLTCSDALQSLFHRSWCCLRETAVQYYMPSSLTHAHQKACAQARGRPGQHTETDCQCKPCQGQHSQPRAQ